MQEATMRIINMQEGYSMDERGMTLIELLIVSVVISILVLVVSFEFKGWQTRYKVEAQIKNLYGDLMEMRMRALQTNTMHYIHLDSSVALEKSYSVYRDNGDNDSEIETDTRIIELSKDDLEYKLRFNGGYTPMDIEANNRGLMNLNRTIWVVDAENKKFLLDKDGGVDGTHNTDVDIDYNCVVISKTRVNIGKIDDKGKCVAK
jgi:prepilin-type N-terminal cleavage/methylation domain-containing protein